MRTSDSPFHFFRLGRVFQIATALIATKLAVGTLSAVIVVVMPGVEGTVEVAGKQFESAFVVDSFSFGVDRELAAGDKGGTEDINIGVGELQECTISKSMDASSGPLFQSAISGNSVGAVEIHFIEIAPGSEPETAQPVTYLKYKLDRCFVKSWSTSGDADDRPTEEVAFYYNRVAFIYATTMDGMTYQTLGPYGWDQVLNKPWTESGLTLEPTR